MNDKELKDIIADKIMGDRLSNPKLEPLLIMDPFAGSLIPRDIFDPLNNDLHCMMAWDVFSENRWCSIEKDDAGWVACYNKGNNSNYYLDGGYFNDRRRAMVVCMVKAVTS